MRVRGRLVTAWSACEETGLQVGIIGNDGMNINNTNRTPRIAWLVLRDILLRYAPLYVWIGVLSMAGFGMQLLGLSGILNAITDAAMPFGVEQWISLIEPGVAIGLAFILLSLSAGVTFLARRCAIRMMIDYERHCAGLLFRKVAQGDSMMDGLNDSTLLRFLSKDCRFGGRIVQEISNIVMPVGVALLALPLLFYLDAGMTMILLAVMLIALAPFAWMALKAKEASHEHEEATRTDSEHKKEALKQVKAGSSSVSEPVLPHPAFQRAYEKRLVIPQCGILVGMIQIALCLTVLAWWIAGAERPADDLGHYVFYSMVAVFALLQLRSAAKVFASYHVFLTYFRRAFVVIHGIHMPVDELRTAGQPEMEDGLIEE